MNRCSAVTLPVLQDFIRKKSLVCLQKMLMKNPNLCDQIHDRVLECLSDQDPGVVAVTVQVARSICELRSEASDLDLARSLALIQEQILDKKLPPEYNFHSEAAPWFQSDLLSLMALIVERSQKWDPDIYEAIGSVIVKTMDEASPKEPIGQAIIYECIKVISALNLLESDLARTSKALNFINRFLQSKHNNAKYTGLSALELLLRKRPPQLSEAQEDSVLQCLSHYDDSIRRKTLSLLYVLANESNVRVICEKLIEHVRLSEDEFQRRDLIAKTMDLAERLTSSLDWHASVMLKLLQCSGGVQRETIMGKMTAALGEDSPDKKDEDEVDRVGAKLTRVLKKIMDSSTSIPPPVTVLRLYVWCFVRFGDAKAAPGVVCDVGSMQTDFSDPNWQPVLGACLDAIFHLVAQSSIDCDAKVEAFVRKCTSNSTTVSELAWELQRLLENLEQVKAAMEGDKVTFKEDETLSFLDGVVVDSLREGKSKPYRPRSKVKERMMMARSSSSSANNSLRLTSYQQMDESSRSGIQFRLGDLER